MKRVEVLLVELVVWVEMWSFGRLVRMADWSSRGSVVKDFGMGFLLVTWMPEYDIGKRYLL